MKTIYATDAKPGTVIIVEQEPCTVKSLDVSKTGKHGASKCRIETIGVFDGKKRIIVVPGSERFETPLIEKKRAQVLSVQGNKANIMDSETFETLDIEIEEGLDVSEGASIEYWQFGNKRMIKRKV
ncbi:MAG: translation initiation factor IF-5A [Candidatus Pacearchaeota archaeon]